LRFTAALPAGNRGHKGRGQEARSYGCYSRCSLSCPRCFSGVPIASLCAENANGVPCHERKRHPTTLSLDASGAPHLHPHQRLIAQIGTKHNQTGMVVRSCTNCVGKGTRQSYARMACRSVASRSYTNCETRFTRTKTGNLLDECRYPALADSA